MFFLYESFEWVLYIMNKVKTKKKIKKNLKKIEKNGHCRESSEFFGQKPFLFGKNYY